MTIDNPYPEFDDVPPMQMGEWEPEELELPIAESYEEMSDEQTVGEFVQGLHLSMEELTTIAAKMLQEKIEREYTLVIMRYFLDTDLWIICRALLPGSIGDTALIHLLTNDHRIMNNTPPNIAELVADYSLQEEQLGAGQLPARSIMLHVARHLLRDGVLTQLERWLKDRVLILTQELQDGDTNLDEDNHPF